MCVYQTIFILIRSCFLCKRKNIRYGLRKKAKFRFCAHCHTTSDLQSFEKPVHLLRRKALTSTLWYIDHGKICYFHVDCVYSFTYLSCLCVFFDLSFMLE